MKSRSKILVTVTGAIFVNIIFVVLYKYPFSKPIYNVIPENQISMFKKGMTDQDAREYVHLAKVLTTQLDRYNITYFANFGTLLGINRHLGPIPWDDDIDISIDGRQKQNVVKALQSLDKEYTLLTDKVACLDIWKFFRKSGKPIKNYIFTYPFIDLLFWNETLSGYFVDEFFTYLKWPRNKTFPLMKRMYGDMEIYTPCDMETIVECVIENVKVCVSPHMIHKEVKSITKESLSCDVLKLRYPFVKREYEKGSDHTVITDSLLMNNSLVKKVRYNIPKQCSGDLSYFDSHLQVLFDTRKRI